MLSNYEMGYQKLQTFEILNIKTVSSMTFICIKRDPYITTIQLATSCANNGGVYVPYLTRDL